MGLFRPPLPQVTVEGTVPGLPQFVNEHGVHLSLHTPTGTLLCARQCPGYMGRQQ